MCAKPSVSIFSSEKERSEGGRASCLSHCGTHNGPHLHPSSPANWVMVGGGGDDDDEQEVVGF